MIELKNISKTFVLSDGSVDALNDVSLSIEDGDIYGIIGASGAGKSTLVRCINMLERPTSGSVIIDNTDLCKLSEKQLREERKKIAMIFQCFNLMMQKNCLKNVCFPLELEGVKHSEAKKRARELLETVGLLDKEKAYPAQLSGGQTQRVAIARALVNDPQLIIADEPTGNIDPELSYEIVELLKGINDQGTTILMVTHEHDLVRHFGGRIINISEGRIAYDDVITGLGERRSQG